MGQRDGARNERGMVTAEAAVALPGLFVVLAAAVFLLVCLLAQIRCVDVARDAARAAARGEPPAAVQSAALRAMPEATVEVSVRGPEVTVRVSREIRPLGGWLAGLPGIPVHSAATAHAEPGVAAP